MGTLSEDLTTIKNVEDTLIANKVARFCYTDTAYTNNDANGVDTYDYDEEQNIPNPTTSILKVNSTVLDKGYRAQASSITRMLVNHFFGRISYNLNKINDNMSSLIATLRAHAGTANGFATLDANGRIPYSQLPESAIELKGYWNASTNTPTLADGTGTNGDEYIVDTAGTQDLGSGSQYFGVGDRVLYTSGVWKNISSGFVRSVNGITPNAQGDVTNVVGGAHVPISKSLFGVIFGRFLARTWKRVLSCKVEALAYANGLSVCGTYDDGVWWSETGEQWTKGTGLTTEYIRKVTCVNNMWFASVYNGSMWWSDDGKDWHICDGDGVDTAFETIQYAEGVWVAKPNTNFSDGLVWSEDGKTWTKVAVSVSSWSTQNIAYGNNIWVCVASNTQGFWWSEDGKNWNNVSGISASVFSLTYAKGIFVAGATNGLWWSEDGKTWTQSSITTNVRALLFGDEYFIACITDGGIIYSYNGKSWSTTSITTGNYGSLYYANGIWLAQEASTQSLNGRLLWSNTPATTWTYTGNRIPSGVVMYSNGLWVRTWSDSSGGGAYYSEDGINWTINRDTNHRFTKPLVYANGRWLTGIDRSNTGYGIWCSSIDSAIEEGLVDLSGFFLVD